MVVLWLFYGCLMAVAYPFYFCGLCVAGGLASTTWIKHPPLLQNEFYTQCSEAPRRMRRLSDADGVEAFRRMCSFSGEGGVERSTRLRRNSLDEKLALGTDDEDTSNARTVYLITFARLLFEAVNTIELRDPSTLRHTYNTEGTSPSDAVTAEFTSSERFLLAQPSAACLLTD